MTGKPTAAITFLTYEDLAAGDRFYRTILGLPLIEDQGWAKVYRISNSSHVGLVQGYRMPALETPGTGVLLSIVVGGVKDVDAWYVRLRDTADIRILNPPSMVSGIPVYSFFLLDPAGYRIEIQAFTDQETASSVVGH